ncbi:MAG: DUF4129 domain-containing protein [Vicinamibacteria bacterium]
MTTALASLALIATVAAADADLRGQAQAIVTKGGYQTTLPAGTSASTSPSPPPARSRSRGGRPSRIGGPGVQLIPAGVMWPVLAAIGVCLLGLVLARVREARRGRERPERPAGPERVGASGRRPLRIGPLTDVEDLARQGRFGEAIHLLLLHLFAALQRRPATAPAPAHTGREVLARTRLASQAHDALGVLVTAAEKVHFGGREASREDYDACLAHYRRFLDSFERAGS